MARIKIKDSNDKEISTTTSTVEELLKKYPDGKIPGFNPMGFEMSNLPCTPKPTKTVWGVLGINRNKLAEELSRLSAEGKIIFTISASRDIMGTYDVVYYELVAA